MRIIMQITLKVGKKILASSMASQYNLWFFKTKVRLMWHSKASNKEIVKDMTSKFPENYFAKSVHKKCRQFLTGITCLNWRLRPLKKIIHKICSHPVNTFYLSEFSRIYMNYPFSKFPIKPFLAVYGIKNYRSLHTQLSSM